MSIFCLTVVLRQRKALILTLGGRVVASKDIYVPDLGTLPSVEKGIVPMQFT